MCQKCRKEYYQISHKEALSDMIDNEIRICSFVGMTDTPLDASVDNNFSDWYYAVYIKDTRVTSKSVYGIGISWSGISKVRVSLE